MLRMKEDEYCSMKPLRTKIEQTEIMITGKEIKQYLPAIGSAQSDSDLKVLMNHYVKYILKYQEDGKKLVDNIDYDFLKDKVKNKSVEVAVCYYLDKQDYIKKSPYVEEVYSDWTNKLLGWQLTMEDGTKILFQKKDEIILTNSNEIIDVDKNEFLSRLLNRQVLYYGK